MSNLTQYSTYTPPAEEQLYSSYQATRVLDGATRVTMSNGDSINEALGVSTFDSRTDINTFDKSDWRSTARTATGTPTQTIGKDTVVTINGISAPADSLHQAGQLAINERGEYVIPAQKAPTGPSESEKAEAAEHIAYMAPTTVASMDDAVSVLDDASLETMTQYGMASVLGNMSTDDLVKQMSQKSGLDPVASAARVETVRSSYQTQADDYLVGKVGLPRDDLEGFYAFCKESKNKAALSNAINRQVYSRSLDGYPALVTAYYASTIPSDQSMSTHGLETKKASDGTTLVKYASTWISVKVAARLGLL
jgi:hypothetical protein